MNSAHYLSFVIPGFYQLIVYDNIDVNCGEAIINY